MTSAAILDALVEAEGFMSGFEGDPFQPGIDRMLARIRAAIADGRLPDAARVDGPYSPELADAFREGARVIAASVGDKLEVRANADVRECEGDGVLVAAWIYVHDAERAPLAGEISE